jgi:hypothetical protein
MNEGRNITTAATEYYTRPADERFDSLKDLITAAQYDREHSAEREYNLRDLRAVIVPDPAQPIGGPDPAITAANPRQALRLASPNGQGKLTHWSFGQLARTIGAPASYLRTLPPAIAADAINYGLHEAAPVGTRANLLVRANGGEPIIRAATSDSYGRLWDAQLYGEVSRYFGDGQTSNGGRWMTPPAWPGSLPSGQYRGDRDSFVIRVDGGSIVTDPSASRGDGGQLYRGIMLRNSEVGHCSVSIECVLYRYICGNHNLWGAIMDRQFKRRHVGTKITRDTMRELADLAYRFNQRTARQDEQIIEGLISHELAHTREAVIDELRKIGYTKEQAIDAYATCEAKEQASPRSFWGIAQGTTRISQQSGYQDDRLALDQLAAQVLKRGAALVTV